MINQTIRPHIKKADNCISNLSKRLFWFCYKRERCILSFVKTISNCYINLPSFQVIARVVVIFCLITSVSIPEFVFAENVGFYNLHSNLKVLNPVIGIKEKDVKYNIELPLSGFKKHRYSKKIIVTFYSSDPDQTDDTPYVTASGAYVRDGIAASNCLPLGTRIKIPAIYGDKVFVIQDRMNERYKCRIDIWVKSREEAVTRGVEFTEVLIF